MSKRVTLSDREIEIIATILAYMSSRARAMGDEGSCLLKLQNAELHVLRKRLAGE